MKYVFKKKSLRLFIPLFDAIGRAVTRRSSADIKPHNILVIRLDHLGDVLLAAPVAKALKENFPKARVTFLAGSWAEPILRGNPFIDEVLVYDAPWFARGPRRTKENFFALAKRLRAKKFDTAIGLRGDLRENFLMARAGIPQRIGFGVTGGGFWLTHEVFYRPGVHEAEHLKDLLAALSVHAGEWRPRIYLEDGERAEAKHKAEAMGFEPGTRWVGFQATAGAPSKNWPDGNRIAFLTLFASRFSGYGLVLVGGEPVKSDEIGVPKMVKCLNLAGKASLRELAAILPFFEAFVGPDSGPTHIAAASGVPTVFIYSGTNEWERWRPLPEDAVTLRNPVECSPCELEICPVKGHPCLSGIPAEQVIRALESKLKK